MPPLINGLRIPDLYEFLAQRGCENYLPPKDKQGNIQVLTRPWLAVMCGNLKFDEFQKFVEEAKTRCINKNPQVYKEVIKKQACDKFKLV